MFALYVLVLALVGRCLGQAMTPGVEYVLNFDSPVYMCPDVDGSKFVDTSNVVVKQVDGAAVLGGSIHFLQGVDHNTMILIQLNKEMSGRFELIFSHEVCDLCNEIQNEESEYKEYLKYFGFAGQCPPGSQEYQIQDFTADPGEFPVNGANAGNYQANVIIYNTNGDCDSDGKALLACMKIDFVVEPEK